jgi:hypothetical protein
VTRVVAHERCAICGGLLVPSELAFEHVVPPNADYACLQCGRPYYWLGDPPRLRLGSVDHPSDENSR